MREVGQGFWYPHDIAGSEGRNETVGLGAPRTACVSRFTRANGHVTASKGNSGSKLPPSGLGTPRQPCTLLLYAYISLRLAGAMTAKHSEWPTPSASNGNTEVRLAGGFW